ncbi:hypothetical protein D3C78_1689730 [compost metagenome]
MLDSISSIRRFSLALVKLRSRLFTALNLLPSMAIRFSSKSPNCWHSTTNWRQTPRMPLLLSFRKLAMVLKSGTKRPVNHISSTLRWASRSRRRLD